MFKNNSLYINPRQTPVTLTQPQLNWGWDFETKTRNRKTVIPWALTVEILCVNKSPTDVSPFVVLTWSRQLQHLHQLQIYWTCFTVQKLQEFSIHNFSVFLINWWWKCPSVHAKTKQSTWTFHYFVLQHKCLSTQPASEASILYVFTFNIPPFNRHKANTKQLHPSISYIVFWDTKVLAPTLHQAHEYGMCLSIPFQPQGSMLFSGER